MYKYQYTYNNIFHFNTKENILGVICYKRLINEYVKENFFFKVTNFNAKIDYFAQYTVCDMFKIPAVFIFNFLWHFHFLNETQHLSPKDCNYY